MIRFRIGSIALIAALSVNCGGAGVSSHNTSAKLVSAKSIELPKEFEGKRADYIDWTEKAFARVLAFAKANHLPAPKPLERVIIVPAKKDFDAKVPGAHMPAQLASVEKYVLVSVSEPAYLTVHLDENESHFEKHLAHAIATQLHRDIAGDDEGALGPDWFQQGFAAAAADQYPGEPLAPDDARAIARNPEGKGLRAYVALVRYLNRRSTMAELIRRAGASSFSSWIDMMLA